VSADIKHQGNELINNIFIAHQDADKYLDVPSSRDGDFQEENRDSPLEWLSTGLAWASHVIEIYRSLWYLKVSHL
jgi:hypothetical protein